MSHHPSCDRFKGHTINIKKVHLCIGCFIGYPSAILGILLFDYIKLNTILNSTTFLIIGIIFVSSFALSLLNLTKIKVVKIIQKFLIGIGSACIFWGIMLMPNPSNVNLIMSYSTLIFMLTILNIYHTYGFYRTCVKCEIPFNWARCDGFYEIRKQINRYKLRNIFDSFDEISAWFLTKRKQDKKR